MSKHMTTDELRALRDELEATNEKMRVENAAMRRRIVELIDAITKAEAEGCGR